MSKKTQKRLPWVFIAFETNMVKHALLDFTRKDNGYADSLTDMLFTAFKLGHQVTRDHGYGHFVIGRHEPVEGDQHGRLVFGEKPRVHPAFPSALVEAKRLQSENPDHTFNIYQSVNSIKKSKLTLPKQD